MLAMYIRNLSLRHFRTYARLEIDFPAAPILLLGANAQGKTSLLEAIAYLALGRSPLTNTDQQLIHWAAATSGMPFAQVQAEVQKQQHTEVLEIVLQRSQLSNGNTRLDKRIRVNQKAVRRAALAGHLNVVVFMPGDVALVGGPPSARRRNLDDLLSQVYPEYVTALAEYQRTISRRNALLRHLGERRGDMAQLDPLEEKLAQTGVLISLYRRRVLAALSSHADRIHQELTGGASWLRLAYRPNFDPLKPPALDYQLGLLSEVAQSPVDVDALQQAYREMFLRRRPEELRRGVTLTGPHRDEIRFLSEEVDLGTYGSRGEQRTAILALRLAELHWLQQQTGEAPVLLLDEVLAELDRERRKYLLGLVDQVEQTILATTDVEMFPEAFRRKTQQFEVVGGIITPVKS